MRFLFHLLLPLLLPAALQAATQQAEVPKSSNDEATSAEAQEQSPVKTLVLRMEARRQVESDLALAMESVVQSTLANDSRRVVFGQEDLRRVFEFESERQAMGCTDSNCLAELANAMDAHRLVLGTMDKIGNGYLVGLTEIDGKTLKPLGRVQGNISAKEEELLRGVQALTVSLMQKVDGQDPGQKQVLEASAPTSEFALAGSVAIDSVPAGASVWVAGKELGKTPTVLHNLAVGNVTVELRRDSYRTVRFEAPIFQGKQTGVKAELLLARKRAQEAHRFQMEAHEKEVATHRNWACGKIGCGALFCLGSPGLFIQAQETPESSCSGLSLLAIGSALGAWGGLDLMKKFEAPRPDWELPRQVRIQPPKGLGKPKVKKTLKLIQKADKK